MKAYMIYSYGGAEVLEGIFNGMASLISGGNTFNNATSRGTFFTVFVRLGFTVGFGWVVLSALQGQFLKLITSWMLPFYAMLSLFFVPTTTVWIKDLASGYTAKVDHVPWGLGALGGTVSSLSHTITQTLESVFSLPDDLKYHQTGAMMASQLIAQSRLFHITNVDLSETMKDFMTQCVVYEALLGQKYTLDDVKHSPDLWTLIKDHASPARSFSYREPGHSKKRSILTCAKGVTKLETLLTQEIESAFTSFGSKIFPAHASSSKKESPQGSSDQAPSSTPSPVGNLLKGYLESSLGYMSGLGAMSKTGVDLMRQQMMMASLIESIDSKSTSLGNASNFALRRAYLHQRTQQESLGQMAEKTMIAFKNVIEALVYVSFMFVLPMVLMPRGWRHMSHWASLVVWVNLWPPLYAVVHYIMMVAARSKGMPAIVNEGGITLANSVGFTDLHADMAACAGYLSLSVGALSYALIKGGISGLNQLAGSLSGSASSSVQRATDDLMSGNYSFGNVSLGSVQAFNESLGQQMHSPQYASGAFTQNDGSISRVTSADGQSYVSVSNSNLRSGVNWSESLSSTFSQQAQNALTASHSHAQGYTESQAQGYRQAMELASHQAKSQSFGEGLSSGQQTNEQKAYTHLDSMAETFARDNKMSKEHAFQVLAKASASFNTSRSLPGKILEFASGLSGSLETGINYTQNNTSSEIDSKAYNFAKSDSYQKALQDTVTFGREGRFNEQDEASKRFQENMNTSFDKSDQYRHDVQASLQKADSYTKAASYAQQQSSSLNASLNQEFVNWLPQQSLPHSNGSMGRQAADTLLSGEAHHLIPYQQRFLETYSPQVPHHMGLPINNEAAVRNSYDHFKTSLSSSSSLTSDMTHFNDRKDREGFGSTFEKILHDKKDTLASHVSQKKDDTQNYIADYKESHRNHAKKMIPMEKLGGDVIPNHEQYPYLPPTRDTYVSAASPSMASPSVNLVYENISSPANDSLALDLTLPKTHDDLRKNIRTEIDQALEEANEKASQSIDPKLLGLSKS